jgi:U3 small nucleolar RNA-associated protein 20
VTDYEGAESFFKTAFDHWVEVNLSENFTDFAEKCEPLTLSLTLVIHHQKEIMDLLEYHIKKQDIHSLESLLE